MSIITFYVLFLSKWIRKIVLAFKLPGPKALPFIGNCLLVTSNEGKKQKKYFLLIFILIFTLFTIYKHENKKDLIKNVDGIY